MRRELWEVLVEMVESLNPEIAQVYGMHIQDITLDVPVEVIAIPTQVGFRLIVDLPQSRWQEGLSHAPGRMRVIFQELTDGEL